MRSSLLLIGILALTTLAMACTSPPSQGPGQPGHPQGDPARQGGPPGGGASDHHASPPTDGAAGPQGELSGDQAQQQLEPKERLKGDWQLQLTPSQQRQYELLQLAFRDPPPTEDEIAALGLSSDESLMIGMVLMGREQNPGGDAMPEVRSGLEELTSATLVVTDDQLAFSYGQDRDVASYTVLEQTDSTLALETTTTVEGQPVVEKVDISFEGADRMSMAVQGDPESAKQSFARRAAPDTEAQLQANPRPAAGP